MVLDHPTVLECWSMFLQHRKELKKPMTPTAQKMALKKVESLSHGSPALAIAILEQTMENNWMGIFPLTPENTARMRAEAQLEVKRKPCEHCGKPITENGRYRHEDDECPNFRRVNPKNIEESINTITKALSVH